MNRPSLRLLTALSAAVGLLGAGCPAPSGTTMTSEATSGSSSTTASASGTTMTTTAATTGTSEGTSGSTTATTATTATTTTATTGTTTSGAVPCTQDPLPMEGTPCANEGEICSPGCEDPCSFCNILECAGGTWQGLEVFPAPCLPCEEICPYVVAAGCSGGAPDMESCVAGCVDSMTACPLEHNVMLACVGPEPEFLCDELDRPSVPGCEDSFETLYECLQ